MAINVTDIQDAIISELVTITSPAALDAGRNLDGCGFNTDDLPYAWVRRGELASISPLGSGIAAVLRNYPIWLYVEPLVDGAAALDDPATYDTASNWIMPMLRFWWDRQSVYTSDGTALRVIGLTDTGDVGLMGRENSQRFVGAIFNLQIESIEQRG